MTDSAEERDEFLQIYLEESGEETEQLVKLLLRLEEDPDDMETLREAFRLLHTFKGSSGMMGYDRINALAHELETRFDACRSQREKMTSETVSVALRCVDFFIDFLVELADGKEDQGDPAPLIEALAAVATVPADSPPDDSDAGDVVAQASGPDTHAEPASAEQDSAPESAPETEEKTSSAVVPDQSADQQESTPATSSEKSVAELRPIVAGPTTGEAGPAQEVTLGVRLSERIELPDLKARLIIARLQALGEVISTEPALETIDELEPPITLQIRVRSTSDHQVLASSIDLEGVASVYVAETAAVAAPSNTEEKPDSGRGKSQPQETTPRIRRNRQRKQVRRNLRPPRKSRKPSPRHRPLAVARHHAVVRRFVLESIDSTD